MENKKSNTGLVVMVILLLLIIGGNVFILK